MLNPAQPLPQPTQTPAITASMLYSLVSCPHRVTMDLFADPAQRDAVSPFVELLWERGSAVEADRMAGLRTEIIDLHTTSRANKAAKTLEAMRAGAALIYGGRIEADDLVGEPDLLRRDDDGYVPGDIKSGAGREGGGEDGEGRLKETYAVQLGLYVDILERLQLSAGRRGFIWDVHGDEVIYDFTAYLGPRKQATWWDVYREQLTLARGIATKTTTTLPAYASGTCKLCHWYSSCMRQVKANDDLTLIAEFGRARRDAMIDEIKTVHDLAEINPEGYLRGKKATIFKGVGPDMLAKFQARAKLFITPNAKPYLKEPLELPGHARELFFDIEVDPMRDLCYLHGFVERMNGDNATEQFHAFFVDDTTPQAEAKAFADAVKFMRAAQPCATFYYAPYERVIYRKLQAKYPEVCSAADIDALFDESITVDLYTKVVRPKVEFPTSDFSIKTLAKYLGFSWRDTHPSGAASIQWFDEWVRSRNPQDKQRILDYNEDDCDAVRVVLDGIRKLS